MTPDLALTFDEVADAELSAEPLSMEEQEFRAFHARTARPLRSYIAHLTGDATLAEDFVQESYLRLLRASLPGGMDDTYRKNYLFRIATNLVRDHFRSPRNATVPLPEIGTGGSGGEKIQIRADVQHALQSLKPREREMLWLAYVEGSSHKEIAEVTGMKAQSIRPLLFRARQKAAALLRAGGFEHYGSSKVES